MDNVTMFNFKTYWNLVEPHLNDPEVLELLNSGMRTYCSDNPLAVRISWDRDGHKGPWFFSIGDYWKIETELEFSESTEFADFIAKYESLAASLGYHYGELFDNQDDPKLNQLKQDHDKELLETYNRTCPQPNTYEWYQCLGAERYLAPWQKALAEKIFPDYEWEIYEADWPCNGGYPIIGRRSDCCTLIFDIFNFNRCSVKDILEGSGLLKPRLAS